MMTTNNHLNETPLATSKLKLYVYFVGIPLFLFSMTTVIFYLIDIAQGGEMVNDIAHSRRGGRMLVWPFAFLVAGCVTLWFYRKVSIYPDRMEVRYPLHKDWASTVNMADVDEYCVELQENDDNTNERIFLLTGNKLWYYIGENECRNFKEMKDILESHFHLPRHDGNIALTEEDMKTVKHGGYILLED